MTTAKAIKPLTRTSRKKLETKDKLLNSLQLLILERGVDAISINDITEMSDIGLGTFYNYFDSKNTIIDAVSELIAYHYHKQLDQITEGIEDPAMVLATSVYYTYGKIVDGSLWGKFLFDCGLPIDFYLNIMKARSAHDIITGVGSGQFALERDDLALSQSVLSGMLISVSNDLYHGRLDRNTLPTIATKILVILGMDKEDANRVAQQAVFPIPKQAFPLSAIEMETELEIEKENEKQLTKAIDNNDKGGI